MIRFLRDSTLAAVLSFVLVFLVAEVGVRQAEANLPVDPGKWPRIEIAQKLDRLDRAIHRRDRFDVIFVGSSVIAGGIEPVVFTDESGRSAFNAAWAGATARTSAAWVANIIEPLAAPQTIVLGIQTGEMNDNSPKNQITYRKFMRSPGFKQTTESLTARVTSWFERLSYFVKFRFAFRTPTVLFNKDRGALERAKIRKEIGERGRRVEEPISYAFRDKFATNFYDKNLVDLSLDGPEFQSLVDVALEMQDRGVNFVLIGTPVTDDYWSIHDDPAGDEERFRDALQRFQQETGATVIDAIDAFPTSDPFRDPVHLDVEGRIPFSEALAKKWSDISSADSGWFTVHCRGTTVPSCRVRGS